MRLLNEGACPPEINMATDAALLESIRQGQSPATLRLYEWSAPALTYGLGQRLPEPLIAACNSFSLSTFQRPTGGKAVLHGHDLTLALAFPPALLFETTQRVSPRRVYDVLTERLIEAWQRVGIRAVRGTDSAPDPQSMEDGGDCFATPALSDLVNADTGAKLMGCALRVKQDGVLLQASVPLREPVVDTRLLFGRSHPIPTFQDSDRLRTALITAFEEMF
ncbi:MAG: hypothetical protein KIT45_07830 [Fimbriimonadia bacterium]|nr:hypothetical protein [Fimbriimonadia bacterium]